MSRHIRGQIIGHKDNSKGYEFGGGAGFGDFYEGPLNMGELADNATITIHQGAHERVFTEEEVKAMLKEAFRGYDRTGAGVSWGRMKQVAGERGLTFDPIEP